MSASAGVGRPSVISARPLSEPPLHTATFRWGVENSSAKIFIADAPLGFADRLNPDLLVPARQSGALAGTGRAVRTPEVAQPALDPLDDRNPRRLEQVFFQPRIEDLPAGFQPEQVE